MNRDIQDMISNKNFETLENYLLDSNNIFILSDLEDFYAIIDNGILSPQKEPLLSIIARHCSKKTVEILIQRGVSINTLYPYNLVKKNVFYFLFKHFFKICDGMTPILRKGCKFDNILRAIKHLLEIAQDTKIHLDLSPCYTFDIPKNFEIFIGGYVRVNVHNSSPLQLIAELPITKEDAINNKELIEDIIAVTKLLLSSGQDIFYKGYNPQEFSARFKWSYQWITNGIELKSSTVFERVVEPAIVDTLINYSPQETLIEYKNRNLLTNSSSKIVIRDKATFFAFKHSFFGLDFKIKAAQEFLSAALSAYKKEDISIEKETAIFLAKCLSCKDAENLGRVSKAINQATKSPLMQSNLAENESTSTTFRELVLERNSITGKFL